MNRRIRITCEDITPLITRSSISERIKRPQLSPGGWRVLASAVLMVISFPSPDQGWVAWFAVAPLLASCAMAARPLSAFLLGWSFGFVVLAACIPWIGETIVIYSGSALGWAGWLLLSSIKGLWFGVVGVSVWVIRRRVAAAAAPVAVAAAWTIVEWLRTQGSLAMPWCLLGYTQHRALVVIQVADLGGVLAVSFVVCLVNAALAQIITGAASRARELAPVWCSLTVVVAVMMYGAWCLAHPRQGPVLKVAAVQPNLRSGQREVRSPESIRERLRALSRRAAAGRPALVVWPESVASRDVLNDPAEAGLWRQIARRTRSPQLLGGSVEDVDGDLRNSALVVPDDGAPVRRYDKQWLVPYGEWVPARWMLAPVAGSLHLYDQDVRAGTAQAPMRVGEARLGVLICFESIFPVLSRRWAASGANLLVSITNDGWAGESAALAQHAAMTAFRAVETRRYVIASALTGVTGVVDPAGRWSAVEPYREDVWSGSVALLDERTAYSRAGDWPVGASWFLLAVAFTLGAKRGRHGSRESGQAVY